MDQPVTAADDALTKSQGWIQGVENYYAGNYRAALPHFLKISPSFWKQQFNIAVIYLRQDAYEAAIKYLSTTLTAESSFVCGYFLRGTCQHLRGALQEAVIDYTTALELMRGETEIDYRPVGLPYTLRRVVILYNRGLCWFGLGVFHRARDDLLEAKRLEKQAVHAPLLYPLKNLLRIVNQRLAAMPVQALFTTRNLSIASTEST